MFRGKKYKDSSKLIDRSVQYDVADAMALVVKAAPAKFDETVEIHIKLGVDSRHADQQVRGAIVLPNGTGKTRKVLVKYETPYLRYQPAKVEVIESTDTDTKTTVYGPDFHDAFHTELKLFAECIATGKQPKTNLEDAVADLELFQEIIRVMAAQKK